MTPCTQSETIHSISRTLDRLEKSQEKVIELLSKVANQDARLDHLEDHAEKSYNDMGEVFDRLRTVELANTQWGIVNSRPAYIIYGVLLTMILTNFFTELYCHVDIFLKILAWLKP